MFESDIDTKDIKIMTILQNDARAPVAEIARQVGMVPSAVHARLRKLEEAGVILGYEPRLEPAALGFGLTAFVFVASDDRPGHLGTADALALLPEVQEVHHITGEDCFLLKVRVRDMDDLSRLMREGIGAVGTVRGTRTTVVFDTVKETMALPLEASVEAPRAAAGESGGRRLAGG
ncbi:MAG: Lrp/AsnC family transcriptional regulator [Thermoanaerobaculia bacterium]